MMKLIKRIRARLYACYLQYLSINRLVLLLRRRRGLVIICYHTVSPELDDYPLKTDIKALKKHLSFLSDNFTILPLEKAIQQLEDGSLKSASRPTVAITFDDGFRDNWTQVTPLLESYQIPATLFVAKSHIESDGSTYLNENELQKLATHPLWIVGAHADSHNSLYSFLPDDLEREIVNSKNWLTGLLGHPPTMFAYPQGKLSNRVVGAVRPHFELAFATGKRIGNEYDRHQILRVCPTSVEDNIAAFARMLINSRWEGDSK